MTNINKNITLNQFQELIEKNLNKSLDYMSDDFNYQQKQALELFRKRIFLEEIIEETISFNKSLSWDNKNDNLKLTKSAEELIEVFKLRSEVYAQMGYQNDFPDVLEGLNFDLFDKKSAIIYYKINQEYTGTCRLIFDSTNKLPSDKEYSFDEIRKKYGIIGEISRNAVKNNQSKGLGLEFKYLMAGIHNVFVNNNIDITVSAMRKEHYKLFSKFGGIDIIEEINEYGNLKTPCVVIYWNPSEASTFFKKAFLK
ncbi:N-acyl amino acid synthase FeeM domain-containing protein [Arcobacter sp.]|uniref:N-acyl amino acid synthase FeeM domain-containing protein n=1 Tax=Arcobacter sp. TaxID=1872629 RepID=UPI003D09CAEB